MIQEFIGSDFTESLGSYYSPPFSQDTKDDLITIGVWLTENGTATMEVSFEGTDWSAVADSTITCSTYGIQTFINAHYPMLYRLVTNQIVTKVKILV